MRLRRLYPGAWGSNCYLLLASDGHAAVVDPSPDAERILQALREEHATPVAILLTHGHFDHMTSLDTLREKAGIPALIHHADADLPADAQKNAFGVFFGPERVWRTPEHYFADGDKIPVGAECVTVLATPGHTAGSVCFLCNSGQDILTGDTLFANGYGRCDLYGGNAAQLRLSLRRLAQLDHNAMLYPGHGEAARLCDALSAVDPLDFTKEE